MWKDISGYKGYYEVNRKGVIRSKTRTIVSKNGVSKATIRDVLEGKTWKHVK